MDNYLGLWVQVTKPPSYLRELLRQSEEICLVSKKKVKSPIHESTSTESLSDDQQTTDFDSTNLDLTGCPLKVDLHGDSLSSTLILDRPNNWTEEEIYHTPVTVNEARKFINQYGRKNMQQPVYCICDGTDKNRTVILGAKIGKDVFMRTQVFVVGIVPYGHYNLSIDYMKSKHLKNAGKENVAVRLLECQTIPAFIYDNMNSTTHILQGFNANM